MVLALTVNCKTLLETCGCPSDKAGGLPEKAALLEQYRRTGSPLVILDAGDAVESTDPPEKAEVMICAMAAAGYRALNVGDQEAGRGADFLTRMASLSPMAFISTNLVFAATREPVVRPFLAIDVGAAKIAVLGVLGSNAQGVGHAPQGLATVQPEDAIKRYLPRVRRQAHIVVVLAHVSPAEGRELARIPGVDLVVGGEQRAQVPEPQLIGRTLWIQPPSYGRFVGVVRLTGDANSLHPPEWRFDKVPWKGARDPEVARIIGSYRAKQAAAAAELLGTSSAKPEGYGGVEKCTECHADVARSWERTKHARAWAALSAGGNCYDAQCFPCHTTGKPGKPPSVALKGVQCEACYLPMSRHAEHENGARREENVDWKAVCIRCHDDERSPGFDLGARLKQIAH